MHKVPSIRGFWKQGAFVALFGLILSGSAWSEDMATLKGRFVLVGEPPPGASVLKIDPTSRGIANVLVYLRPKEDMASDQLESADTTTLVVDESGFNKRIMGLIQGQSLNIQHKGNAAHYVTVLRPDRAVSPTISPEQEQRYKFERSFSNPIPIACDVHENEQAFVFVHSNSHFAITNDRGEFSLTGVPPGNNEFQFWHEITGPLRAHSDWKQGRLRIGMHNGEVDLGEIEIDRDIFDTNKEN